MGLREEIEKVISEIDSEDLDSLGRVQRRLRDVLVQNDKDKIRLHAVYRKDGAVVICDQDGRDFDAVDHQTRAQQRDSRILLEITLVAPHFPFDLPRCELKFSVPLEVEERLPDWMLEHLQGRYGW